jgi:hypothetical protein
MAKSFCAPVEAIVQIVWIGLRGRRWLAIACAA